MSISAARDPAQGLRRLAEGAEECPAHAFGVAEADHLGDAVDRLRAGLDPFARGLDAQPLDRLRGR